MRDGGQLLAEKRAEAERLAADLRRWARWSRNQEMQKALLLAADFLDSAVKDE